MRIQFTILVITVLSFSSYAQIRYEKGYYIDNLGEKTDCLIKNIDWLNNPTEFSYKLSENEKPKIITIKSVKKFGIYDVAKYSRNTVRIDRSSKIAGNLSTSRAPVFNEEELFLKVLVEGKASLYSYNETNLERFFYRTDTSTIEPLIFKTYESDRRVRKNNDFRSQLWNDLKCESILLGNVERIQYKKKELVKLFVRYNKCSASEFTDFEKKQKRDVLNFNIRPGLNNSSLEIQSDFLSSGDVKFDSELGFRLGVEVEVVLPFNKNKWALVFESTYQYYKSEKRLETETIIADYKSIEFPIGLRHYFFLNDNSKIFINASYVAFDLSLNSKIDFESESDLEIETGSNYVLGIGYNYKNKYSLELRRNFSRNILRNFVFWESSYSSWSLIFGYNLF